MPKARLPRLDGKYLCWDCKAYKEVSEFGPGKRGRPYSYCLKCANRHGRERHQQRRQRLDRPPASEKLCPDCQQIKSGTEYYRNPINPDGLSYCCKACNHERGQRRKEKIRGRPPIPIPDGHKRCYVCKEIKPVAAFSKNRARPDHVNVYCKPCSRIPSRDRRLRSIYGITHAQYEEMCEKQNNRCAVCQKEETHIHLGKVSKLSIDHDHVMGQKNIRGLLCNRCNHSISGVEHFIRNNLLWTAINYLNGHGVSIKY